MPQLTPLTAFRARACFCCDHRDDDQPELLTFSLTNGGGIFSAEVLGVDDTGITIYIANRGVFRWLYTMIELPPVIDAAQLDTIMAIQHSEPVCGWDVTFFDHHGIVRRVFTETLDGDSLWHRYIEMWQPQGDLYSGVETMYGSVDAAEFASPILRVPTENVIAIERCPFPESWGIGNVPTTAQTEA